MTTPVLTFFCHKGGVGKTSLIYHLGWMFASLGKRVVIADLDPQSTLTTTLLSEEEVESIWSRGESGSSIYHCILPLMSGGELNKPVLQKIMTNLYLLPGDVELSVFEDVLSSEWHNLHNRLEDQHSEHSLRIETAFWQIMQTAAHNVEAELILVDIGSNLGAINRSALIATDQVIIPLGTDIVSLEGLKSLGLTLNSWRNLWAKQLDKWQECQASDNFPEFELPAGQMRPLGYTCQQLTLRLERPIKVLDRWVKQIPAVYREAVLGEVIASPGSLASVDDDGNCLATIRHYRSLVPMGLEHRKPIFNLTSADGAIGSHAGAVRDAKTDFRELATKIANLIGMQI